VLERSVLQRFKAGATIHETGDPPGGMYRRILRFAIIGSEAGEVISVVQMAMRRPCPTPR
jgi:hypothetical protein